MSQSSFWAPHLPNPSTTPSTCQTIRRSGRTDQLQKEEYFSAQLAHVTLAPFAKGSRRDAGEVLDVVSNHTGSARTEKLVEILHGFGERYRGTLFDAVLCELLGCDVDEVDSAP